jgi:REP element-mobilizing transposase RayT
MPTGYQINDQTKPYFLTLRVVYWTDLFTRQVYRDIVIDSLKYCQKEKGLEIYAWVIMSNHMHLVVRSSKNDLSGTLRDFKKFTSRRITKTIEEEPESRRNWLLHLFRHAAKRQNKDGEYQVWAHNNHAEVTISNWFIVSKVNYIHNNPVKAGIVRNPQDYIYSSASSYAGLEGLLDVLPIDRPWKTYC